jgi:hypothetical protein
LLERGDHGRRGLGRRLRNGRGDRERLRRRDVGDAGRG